MTDPRLSIIPAGAVTDTRLEPRDLQVLCLLGRHTDDKGWCCRSQVKMARELSCGRATVQRALERLDGAGWIEHRPEVRSDGGDQAHFYRVILDVPMEVKPINAAEESASADNGGVPIGGQGVPALDGQGVPTHERAPIRTTPVNEEVEREARAGEGKKPDPRPEDDHDFQKLMKRYPGVHSPGLAFPAWLRLDDEGRRRALARLDAYLAERRKLKNDTVYALQRYLGERIFDQVDEPAEGKSPLTTVPARSREYWWFVAQGKVSKFMFELTRGQGTPLTVPISEIPSPEILRALVSVETGGAAFEAWARHLADKDLRMRADDTHICGKFIYMPSEWPPGHGPPESQRFDKERDLERRGWGEADR